MHTSEPPARKRPARGRILVVDDNVDAADTLAMLLEFLDYETRTAYDGRQALQAAESWQPDLVILDINMPVLDGYAAAREFRAAHRSPRVVLVALTARSLPTDQAAAEAAGFDVHLTKPVDGGQLAGVVEHALQERRHA